MPFVSRAGQKLDHAVSVFGIEVRQKVCADLGSSTGGFVDCLLQRGAARVYAVDTGYGVLDWKLRNDPRVVVMERTNAIHVTLPEPMHLITIDVGWTRQRIILPAARRLLGPRGIVVALIKPHYEAPAKLLRAGVLPEEHVEGIVEAVKDDIRSSGFAIVGLCTSPIRGRGGNDEFWSHLRPLDA